MIENKLEKAIKPVPVPYEEFETFPKQVEEFFDLIARRPFELLEKRPFLFGRELEHLWKALAEDAKARLDRAAELVEQLSENPETMPQTDTDQHNNAIRVYTEALEEFTNISTLTRT